MSGQFTIPEPILHQIGKIADSQKLRVYVVGGYVRDLLLGRQVKDIDIVVEGSGIDFARTVARERTSSQVVVFEKFGTAMLPVGDRNIEFVGARKESYQRDSRKPAIATGTLEDDLSRRDFTVNAIAVSLNAETFGALHDPFFGQHDLAARILRTPLEPETTFDDDPLRILRAIRFAAQLGFTIEPTVLNAAESMAHRLSILSQERISGEFLKIMASAQPSLGLNLLQQCQILKVIFPEVAQLAGVDQRKDYHHKDVFLHTLKVVDKVAEKSPNVWLRMVALLHDIAKPRTKSYKEGIGWTFHGHEELGARMAKSIFRRLKFPFEFLPYVEKLIRLHLRPMALVDEGVTDSAVRRLLFETGNDIDDLMILCRADITSKNPKLVAQVLENYDLVAQKMKEVEEKDRMRNWQPPLRGDEIMRLCGLEPGKLVGILKEAITDAILDGRIPNDHDAALNHLLEIKDPIIAQFNSQSHLSTKR